MNIGNFKFARRNDTSTGSILSVVSPGVLGINDSPEIKNLGVKNLVLLRSEGRKEGQISYNKNKKTRSI